jgi:hypothetical protein
MSGNFRLRGTLKYSPHPLVIYSRAPVQPSLVFSLVSLKRSADIDLYNQQLAPSMQRRPGTDCGAIPASGWRQVRSESNRGAAGSELQRKRPTPSRHARCSRLQWVNFVSDFVGDQPGDPDAMVHPPNGELCNRTSFAPERASTKRNERDRNRTKT